MSKNKMYKKIIFLCFTYLIGMQSSGLSSVPQMIEDISYAPEIAHNSACQPLLNLAWAFYDFCNDNYENFKENNYVEELEYSYANNVNSIRSLLGLIRSLAQNKIDSELILSKLLKTRLHNLNDRAKKFRETKEYVEQYKVMPSMYYIPTYPSAYHTLVPIDQEKSRQATDNYQFVNLIISHLYKMVMLSDLSLETKKLISCSRTLWPLLNEETFDLSYPDFACITYDDDPQNLKGHKDYNYYYSHYDLIPQEITLKNWGNHKTIVLMSRYEANSCFNGKHPGVLELPEPEWLYPEKAGQSVLSPPNTLPVNDKTTALVKKPNKKEKLPKKKQNAPL